MAEGDGRKKSSHRGDNINKVIAPSGQARSKLSLRGAYLYATWQSQQNKKISRDPHVSPSDFLRMTNLIKSSLRADTRGQAIFELGKIN